MDSDSEEDVFVKKTQKVNTKKVSKKKKEASKKRKSPKQSQVHEENIKETVFTDNLDCKDDTIESIYCPTCQAPLHYLKISPDSHAATCAVDWSKLPECSDGENCAHDSRFHYRDFSHALLAEYRASKSFVSPRVKRRIQSKSKPRKTPGTSRKSSQNTETFPEVDDEAKEKVKRKLDLDDPGAGTSTQDTQFEPSFSTAELKKTVDNKFDRKTPSRSVSEKKKLGAELPIGTQKPNFSESHDTPVNSYRKRKTTNDVPLSMTEDSFKQDVKGTKNSDDPGYKIPVEPYFDVPGFSCKKRKLSSESQSSNKDNHDIKTDIKFETGAGVTIKENLNSETRSSSLGSNFMSELSVKGEYDSDTSSGTCRKKCGFATESQLADFSDLNSQPCSSPSISEAPEYLVKGVRSVKVKDEPVEVEQADTEDFFVNSQEFESQMPAQKSETAKEERFSPNGASSVPTESIPLEEHVSDLSADRKNQVFDDLEVQDVHSSASGCTSGPGVKSDVCSDDPFPAFDETDIPDMSSDEEFERCFEKYDLGSSKKQEAESYSDGSSNDSLVFQSASSSKNQEKSKSLWKQILRPKAVPQNTPVSSFRKQRTYSKSRVVTNEAEPQEKTLGEPSKRTCPFYKRIPDTSFVVDAFSYGIIPGVTSYFLSHFHADHYIGLRKSFNKPIYCSKITATLVTMKLGVKEEFLRILNLREPIVINDVEVTALEANHCPGAVMFLFRLFDDRQYLHVGDFRACREMESEPILRKASITALFLDTTYCDQRYTFPLQKDIIQMVVQVVEKKFSECPNLLVVCGSYTIGKEKVFLGILEKFKSWKLWANTTKQRVLNALENNQISSKLVSDPKEAKVHVLPMGELNFQALFQHLSKMNGAFSHVLAFKPTGWEMGKGAKSNTLNLRTSGQITIYGVPYSEHSSYDELCRFTQFIAPKKVIPTVSVGNAASRKRMMNLIDKWLQKSESKLEQKTLKSFL